MSSTSTGSSKWMNSMLEKPFNQLSTTGEQDPTVPPQLVTWDTEVGSKENSQDGCEQKGFGSVQRRRDQKCDEFKITKGTIKTNQDIIGELIRNDGVLAVNDNDKKLA